MDKDQAIEIGRTMRAGAGLVQALLNAGVTVAQLESLPRSPERLRQVVEAIGAGRADAEPVPAVALYRRDRVEALVRYVLGLQGKKPTGEVMRTITDDCAGDLDGLNALLQHIHQRPLGNITVRQSVRTYQAVVLYFGLGDGVQRIFAQVDEIMGTQYAGAQVREAAKRLWHRRISGVYERLVRD